MTSATANEDPVPDTVVYRFVGRSYRIDPERKEAAVLQGSPSGEMVEDDWTDLALGVTTIQTASRYFEDDDAVDLDGDGDPELDWYSSEGQETPDPTGERPAGAEPHRAARERGGAHPARHALGVHLAHHRHERRGPAGPQLGRRLAGVQLTGVADDERPDGYAGDHLYRSAEALIDLRNLGVGE